MILLLFVFSLVLSSIVYLQLDNNNLDDRFKTIYINLITPLLFLILLFFSNSYVVLGLLSSMSFSVVLIYRELLSNFVNTIYLYFYPLNWKIGSKLFFNDTIILEYRGLGFLRTPLYYTDNSGSVMLVPNRDLVSDKISLKI